MRMLSLIAAGAALSFAVPALAEPAATSGFKHDGYTYVYTVEQKGDMQLISGHSYPGGAPFSLVVRGDRVSGSSNGVAVSFNVEDARGAATGASPAKISMR